MFQKISGKGIPWLAIIISLAAGMCMFAPLPGWDKMISFLASLMAISYASAPICFITLRKQLPEQKRPLKLPFAKTWAVVAFYFCNLLTYWSGWNIISKLAIALIIGYAILLIYHFCTKRGREITLNFRESLWLWPYFIGTIIISYLGSFGHGIGVITFGWDFLVIGLFSLLITWLAASICLPAQITKNYISELKIPHQNEIMPNPEK